MPPAPINPNKRMTANPARPVGRYRPGKATHQEESSDDDEDEEEQPVPAQRKPSAPSKPHRPKATTQHSQDEDEDDEEGFVTDEDEDDDNDNDNQADSIGTAVAQSTPNNVNINGINSQAKGQAISEDEDEEDEEEDETDAETSAEDEDSSSSEDEAPQRKFQRPTFIKKTDRAIATGPGTTQVSTDANPSQAQASGTNNDMITSATTLDEQEQQRRRAQAELLIKDKLERDAIARAAGKKSWDDDDDLTPEQMVNDTDGIDPEAEHQAWKLRELRRLKRDREAMEAREKEIEEIERRRNLTAEERDREDEEFVAKQKAEREAGRSQTGFMAKYHHKGAFFQDDENAELVRQRGIMGARFEDDVLDKSTLPEYMRVRDMTKLGKKGRTRYTDLRGQDTGRFGDDVKHWRGSGADDRYGTNNNNDQDERSRVAAGADERFLPDTDRRLHNSKDTRRTEIDRATTTRRSRSRSRSPRRRRDDSRDRAPNTYRSRRRSYSMSKSRSRSRSPPSRRKRSPSPYGDRDKRRRVEV